MINYSLILIVIIFIGGCFNAPIPRRVAISSLSVASIRQRLLNSSDLLQIDAYLDGLARRMGRLHGFYGVENRAAKMNEWQEALVTLQLVEQKARLDWPGLIADPGWVENIGYHGHSYQDVVLILIYYATASIAAERDNPISPEYHRLFHQMRPRKNTLLEKWNHAGRLRGILGDESAADTDLSLTRERDI